MGDSALVASVGKPDLICLLAASSTRGHVPPADISMREEASHFLIVVSYGLELLRKVPLLVSLKKPPEFGKTFYVFHDSAAFSLFEIEKKAHKIETH